MHIFFRVYFTLKYIWIYLDFIFGIKSGIGIQFDFLQMFRILLPNGYIKRATYVI